MFKYVGFVLRAGPRILFSYPWIRKYSNYPEKYDAFIRYSKVHKLDAITVHNLKTEYYISGEEGLPKDKAVVFMPNHQSNMDPLSLIAIYDKPLTFIAKKEIVKFPFVGRVVKSIDGIFINRHNLRQEIMVVKQATQLLIDRPYQNFVIFPEGTRSKSLKHDLGEFKPGSFKVAYNSHRPIVPVAIYGTFRVLDKKADMKRFPIQVKFLNPIYYEEYSKYNTIELSKIVEDIVKKEVDILRKKDEELVAKHKYKNYKKSLDIPGV